jgi:hypothetical protein
MQNDSVIYVGEETFQIVVDDDGLTITVDAIGLNETARAVAAATAAEDAQQAAEDARDDAQEFRDRATDDALVVRGAAAGVIGQAYFVLRQVKTFFGYVQLYANQAVGSASLAKNYARRARMEAQQSAEGLRSIVASFAHRASIASRRAATWASLAQSQAERAGGFLKNISVYYRLTKTAQTSATASAAAAAASAASVSDSTVALTAQVYN